MTTAEVHLWGRRIGAVSIDRYSSPAASFEYDGDFVDSGVGIEPAPLKMKRRRRIYSFPDDSPRTFQGLPGMLVDSLPDKFGTSLLDRWFAEQGKNPADINIVERLLYMADRGMGALSFQPSRNFPGADESSALNINDLGYLANLVIRRDDSLQGELRDMGRSGAALDLIRVGTSAGGARAKAVLAETPEGEFFPGHRIYPVPHRYWLLKFDGIDENSDRDAADPPGMTVVEYIYSLIAKRGGIDMTECRLLEIEGKRHFMIERFDRSGPGAQGAQGAQGSETKRIHYASWCGIAHAHRDWPGAHGYEQLALTGRQLHLSHIDMEQMFRRGVYNIVGVNHDDHSKNFGFLMNRKGEWRLAPAFDLTYACDPAGMWTREHQTSLNGRTSGHSADDLKAFARHCSLTNRDARRIIDEVRSAFAEWPRLSREFEVPVRTAKTISRMLGETARGLDGG